MYFTWRRLYGQVATRNAIQDYQIEELQTNFQESFGKYFKDNHEKMNYEWYLVDQKNSELAKDNEAFRQALIDIHKKVGQCQCSTDESSFFNWVYKRIEQAFDERGYKLC